MIKLLTRHNDEISIDTNLSKLEYLKFLDMPSVNKGIILVEDRLAQCFSELLINKYAPEIIQEYEIVIANSVSEIERNLYFPKTKKGFKILGLFDGDQRDKLKEYNWPYTFLPGYDSLEKQFKVLADNHSDKMAEIMHEDSSSLKRILSLVDGLDPHDWLEESCKKFGLDYRVYVNYLFKLFITENEEVAQETVSEIKLKLDEV